MTERLKQRLAGLGGRGGIMTHVVAGYPDLQTSLDTVSLMADCGVDLVEVQIPFTDPLADGPTIMAANQAALDNGIRTVDVFGLVEKLKKLPIPVLLMTYINIPWAMGFETFLKRAAESGVDGLIMPDIPFDETGGEIHTLCREHELESVFVVSPDTNDERLKKICGLSSSFIYTTLKTGITGAGRTISQAGMDTLKRLRGVTDLPVAAGFGISSPEHVAAIMDLADIAIIGSKVINVFNEDGLKGVEKFLKICVKAAKG